MDAMYIASLQVCTTNNHNLKIQQDNAWTLASTEVLRN